MFGKREYRTEVECQNGPVFGRKHRHTYTVKATSEKEARRLAAERFAAGDLPAGTVLDHHRINVRKV